MNAGEIALFTLKKGSVSLAYLLGAEILCNSKDCNANAIHRMNMISSNLSRKRTVTGEVKLMPIIRTPPPRSFIKIHAKICISSVVALKVASICGMSPNRAQLQELYDSHI